jgi:Bromodomain
MIEGDFDNSWDEQAWSIRGKHVGEEQSRYVMKGTTVDGIDACEVGIDGSSQGNFVWTLETGKIVAHLPPQDRRPALYLWQSNDVNYSSLQVLTEQEIITTKRPSNRKSISVNTDISVEPSVYHGHVMNQVQERFETNIHEFTVHRLLPNCLLHAILEEVWYKFLERESQNSTNQSLSSTFGNSTRPLYYTSPYLPPPTNSNPSRLTDFFDSQNNSSQLYVTIQSLHSRIKAGAVSAYNHHLHHHFHSSPPSDSMSRRSRRTLTSDSPNLYQKGGRVALYLLETLEATNAFKTLNENVVEEKQTMQGIETPHKTRPNHTASATNENENSHQSKIDEYRTNSDTTLGNQITLSQNNVEESERDIHQNLNLAEELTSVDNNLIVSNMEAEISPHQEAPIEAKDCDHLISSESSDKNSDADRTNALSTNSTDDNPDIETKEKAGRDETSQDTELSYDSVAFAHVKDEDVSNHDFRTLLEESKPTGDEPMIICDQENDIVKNKMMNIDIVNSKKADDSLDIANGCQNVDDDSIDATEDKMQLSTHDIVDENSHAMNTMEITARNVLKESELENQTEGCNSKVEATEEKIALEEEEDEEEEDDDNDGDYVSNNPFLQPNPDLILDWIGRGGKSIGINELQEATGICLETKLGLSSLKGIDQMVLGVEGEKFVLDSGEENWDSLKSYDTSTFARCKFRLKSATEDEQSWIRQQELEERYRCEKAWASWRFKSIHSGFTLWPSWLESIKDRIERRRSVPSMEKAISEDAVQEPNDEQLAQALAVQSGSGRRSTRRGNTKDGVFYGAQTHLGQKQLMELIVRTCKQTSMHTLAGLQLLIGDDSTNPVQRLRTALGRLIWKRNQISVMKATTVWSDQPLWAWLPKEYESDSDTGDASFQALLEYMTQLQQTELQLRNMILRQLAYIPTSVIATAADERPGTLESFDSADFEDSKNIEWVNEGHPFIGSRIFRPKSQYAVEASECEWFEVKDFVDSIPLEGSLDDKSDKVGLSVERRMRFRAYPSSGESGALILTEGQVFAGIKAGEQQLQVEGRSPNENPFVRGLGTEVTLRSPLLTKQCIIAGYDTELEILDKPSENRRLHHKLHLLPGDSFDEDSFWVTISTEDNKRFICSGINAWPSQTFEIEQCDYGENSEALQACRKIIDFLKNHKQSGIFMEPVDPVALNLPTYFEVITRPMDITTLSDNLENGLYSKIPPIKDVGRNAVYRMLNGPFGQDALLIFDNAITFNPPNDWVHNTAKAIRKSLVKKMDQLISLSEFASSGKRTSQKTSVYVDEDSDVDMYEYESDREDEDFQFGRREKKRKRKLSVEREDLSLKAIVGPTRLQRTLSESLGLRGPFSGLSLVSDSNSFSLPPEWICRRDREDAKDKNFEEDQKRKEIEEILSLYRSSEESERTGVRRSGRVQSSDVIRSQSEQPKNKSVTLTYKNLQELPPLSEDNDLLKRQCSSRADIETFREQIHECYFAKVYQKYSKQLSKESGYGSFANGSFPPYLGRVLPCSVDGLGDKWEIKSDYLLCAVRWIIRGLIQSGHVTEFEPLSIDAPLTSGVIMASDVYFCDETSQPFHMLEIRRKKKDEGVDESSEDDIELSEYERLRAERVSRNAERLKILGLA